MGSVKQLLVDPQPYPINKYSIKQLSANLHVNHLSKLYFPGLFIEYNKPLTLLEKMITSE